MSGDRCQFVRDGDECVCEYCGRRVKSTVDCGDVIAACRATWRAGDDLEHLLQAVGIFKDDWIALKQKIGLPPHCNCEARKQWLNKASAHLQTKVKNLKQALEAYYSKPR